MNRFGFGAMRLPLINPDDKQSIDMDELKRMVDIYMEAGFTYFDTAFPYHDQMSETALKEALVDRYDRDKYVFADKMPTVLIKSGEEYPLYFNNSLKRQALDILITTLCTIWAGTDIIIRTSVVDLNSLRR